MSQLTFFPSMLAVTLASPFPLAVTIPSSTVTTDVSVDDHINSDLSISALSGVYITFNSIVFSLSIPNKNVFSVMFPSNAIDCNFTDTSTIQIALLPFEVVAVIVASPLSTAVTIPSWLTVATDSLDDDHVTVLSPSVSAGIVAVILVVSPLSSDNDVLSNIIDPISLMTVTSQVATFAPSTVVAVIVAFPLVNPVIVPSCETLAIDVSEDVHFTAFCVVSAGE